MPKRIGFSEGLARGTGAGGVGNTGLSGANFREQAGPAVGTAKAPFTRLIFPPSLYKLPRSRDFNRNVFSSVLAAVAGATVIPVSFALPQNFVGWCQIFGLYVLTPTALTNITFALRVNQGPVEGWDNQQPPPGVANFFVQNFSDVQVPLGPGVTVDVIVTNNSAAGPWTVGAKIQGWYHSRQEEQRIYGEL